MSSRAILNYPKKARRAVRTDEASSLARPHWFPLVQPPADPIRFGPLRDTESSYAGGWGSTSFAAPRWAACDLLFFSAIPGSEGLAGAFGYRRLFCFWSNC